MSPTPQKLIANYSLRGLAVPRAGDRSFVTGSIHSGSRSHLTYTVANPGFGEGASEILGYAPSRQQIFAVFTQKTLILAHFFIKKRHAVVQSL